jgi:uncharacterized protein YndB with AHSA1/START domain
VARRTHTNPNVDPDGRVLIITRLFNAPRERVFEAFVDTKQALQWMGPRGFSMTHWEADVRPGGVWRGCMRATDGSGELWHGGVYREIVPNERLVFTFAWEFAGRGPETLVTITFEDRGGKTLLTFRQGVFDTAENCEGHRAGWESEFDRLAGYAAHLCDVN